MNLVTGVGASAVLTPVRAVTVIEYIGSNFGSAAIGLAVFNLRRWGRGQVLLVPLLTGTRVAPDEAFSIAELKRSLKLCQRRHTRGSDGVSNEGIKNLDSELLRLLPLFQEAFNALSRTAVVH